MSIREHVMKMKEASPAMASLPSEVRNAALRSVQEALSAHREEIFAANREDLKKAEESGISAAVVKLLRFDDHVAADQHDHAPILQPAALVLVQLHGFVDL